MRVIRVELLPIKVSQGCYVVGKMKLSNLAPNATLFRVVTGTFGHLNGSQLRVQVKTSPSQNVPESVKTSPNKKKSLVKTSPKTSPIFKWGISKIYEYLKEKMHVLASGNDI